jgi:hypothetical protein
MRLKRELRTSFGADIHVTRAVVDALARHQRHGADSTSAAPAGSRGWTHRRYGLTFNVTFLSTSPPPVMGSVRYREAMIGRSGTGLSMRRRYCGVPQVFGSRLRLHTVHLPRGKGLADSNRGSSDYSSSPANASVRPGTDRFQTISRPGYRRDLSPPLPRREVAWQTDHRWGRAGPPAQLRLNPHVSICSTDSSGSRGDGRNPSPV